MSRGLTYDSGALLAAERNDRRIWLRHRTAVDHGRVPVVPAPVLAQVWRGGGPRQASLVRLLHTSTVEPLTEAQARRVGVLAVRADHYDIADVAVVEGAARRGDLVVTSDPGDLQQIAAALDTRISIEAV